MCTCANPEEHDRRCGLPKHNPRGEDEAYEKARDEGKFDEPEEAKQ